MNQLAIYWYVHFIWIYRMLENILERSERLVCILKVTPGLRFLWIEFQARMKAKRVEGSDRCRKYAKIGWTIFYSSFLGNFFKNLTVQFVIGEGYIAAWPIIKTWEIMTAIKQGRHCILNCFPHHCFILSQCGCINPTDQCHFISESLTKLDVF